MVFSNVPLAILNSNNTLGHPLTMACANKAHCASMEEDGERGRRGREIKGEEGEQEGEVEEIEVRRGWRRRWRDGGGWM